MSPENRSEDNALSEDSSKRHSDSSKSEIRQSSQSSKEESADGNSRYRREKEEKEEKSFKKKKSKESVFGDTELDREFEAMLDDDSEEWFFDDEKKSGFQKFKKIFQKNGTQINDAFCIVYLFYN